MKPDHIKDLRKKEVRQLAKKLRKLWDAQRALGYMELKKPIRHGWHKHLILREDIARRKDAHVFQEILDSCSHWVWGRDKKHLKGVWQKMLKRQGAWQFPGFNWITKEKYAALSNPAKKHFKKYEYTVHTYFGPVIRKRYYCLVPKYYYRFTYAPAFNTHRKIIDGSLEEEEDEIEIRLHFPEFYYLHFGRRWKPKWLRKHGNRKKRRSVSQRLCYEDWEDFVG